MAKEKEPMFWYPHDIQKWMASETVSTATGDQYRALHLLLCHQWSQGSLPAEPKLIGRMLGYERPDSATYFLEDVWPHIEHLFPEWEDGRRRNPVQDAKRTHTESVREARSRAGGMGGRPSKPEEEKAIAKPKAKPIAEANPKQIVKQTESKSKLATAIDKAIDKNTLSGARAQVYEILSRSHALLGWGEPTTDDLQSHDYEDSYPLRLLGFNEGDVRVTAQMFVHANKTWRDGATWSGVWKHRQQVKIGLERVRAELDAAAAASAPKSRQVTREDLEKENT